MWREITEDVSGERKWGRQMDGKKCEEMRAAVSIFAYVNLPVALGMEGEKEKPKLE